MADATGAAPARAGAGASEEAGWPENPSTHGMFLFRREIGGETWWGHDGYWGTTAFTCPARDVTVVAGHQRSDMPEEFDRLEILGRAFAAVDLGETA